MKRIILLCLVFIMSCTQPSSSSGTKAIASKTSTKVSTQTKKTQETLTKAGSEESETEIDTKVEPALVDPDTVTGSINTKVTMSISDIINDPNILFPQISFTKGNSDFFQVLRCVASYEMLTLQGESVRKTTRTLPLADRKYAWSQARDDRHNCKVVGQYVLASSYVDLPAPTGSFFYIANACVDASHSASGQEGCSFKFSFTDNVIDYENAFIEKMRDKALELSEAQASLYARLDDVRQTARKFEVRLHLCEEYFAFKESEKSIQRGLIMVVLNIAGAVVGAVVGVVVKPLGVAGGAVMIGMLTQMMGSMIVNEALNLGPQINSCLNGEDKVLEMGLQKQKDIERARVYAQELQNKFNVKNTIDHLSELVRMPSQEDPVGGLIAQDLARMKKVMTEMNAIDSKVTSGNSAMAAANKFAQEQVDLAKSGGDITSPSP